MSEPPRHGASFGKVLGLRLEVNYMNGLPLENDAACNASPRARETKVPASVWDCAPVGGFAQVLPIQFEKGYVVRFAVACRTPDEDLQHRLEFSPRGTDDLSNLLGGPLLFERLVTLAGQPRDLSFLAVICGTVTRSRHSAALRYLRLAAARFSRFAACS